MYNVAQHWLAMHFLAQHSNTKSFLHHFSSACFNSTRNHHTIIIMQWTHRAENTEQVQHHACQPHSFTTLQSSHLVTNTTFSPGYNVITWSQCTHQVPAGCRLLHLHDVQSEPDELEASLKSWPILWNVDTEHATVLHQRRLAELKVDASQATKSKPCGVYRFCMLLEYQCSHFTTGLMKVGAGIAQWLERRTHDWMVTGSSPCGSYLLQGQLSVLTLISVSVTVPPHVTRKR